MKYKSAPSGLGAIVCIGILILDSKTALSGAQEGIRLCLQTVIPSLFPFFVLSGIITNAFFGYPGAAFSPLGKLFLLPEGAESILIPAFLGGYPVGARSVAEAYRHGQLDPEEAQRMLAFCNNPGPAFLFGMGGVLFTDKRLPWVLWSIIIISSLAVARIFPVTQKRSVQLMSKPSQESIIHISLKAMSAVCGWVVLFRVVIAFCNRWFLWLLPEWARVMVIGILEISNGCAALSGIAQESLRFLLAVCLFSFGGLCVTMQTVSVTQGLSKRYYLLGKSLQTLFSLVLSLCVICHSWVLLLLLAITIFIFPIKIKNSGSIPRKAIV